MTAINTDGDRLGDRLDTGDFTESVLAALPLRFPLTPFSASVLAAFC